MRIAMFTDSYKPRINGVSISVQSYAEELTRLGHTVCVVCSEYYDESTASSFFETENPVTSSIQVIRISSHKVNVSAEDRLAKIEKWFYVKQEVDKFSPDIVHVQTEFVIGYFGVMYARHRKKPLVYTNHTLWEEYVSSYFPLISVKLMKNVVRKLVRFYLKNATEIVVPSKRIEDLLGKYKLNLSLNCIPTGIPLSMYTCNEYRMGLIQNRLYERFPNIKNKKILLFVGRVAKEKNIVFLLDVLEKLLQFDKNISLLVVGDGPHKEELQKITIERNLDKNVFFTGYIERNDISYMYKLADVFVFPSKTETQGLVTAEAMLAKLPVVAIGEMGTVDIMKGDNGGFMVDDNIEHFTEKVKLLLTDDKLYTKKSEEAFDYGKSWTIESKATDLLVVYNKAIEKKTGKKIK